jgi:hypothetical protein
MDTIGLDLHKRESQLCVLTEEGEIVERRIVTSRERFTAVLGGRAPARIPRSPPGTRARRSGATSLHTASALVRRQPHRNARSLFGREVSASPDVHQCSLSEVEALL